MCKIFPKFQLSLQKKFVLPGPLLQQVNTYTSFAKRYYFLSRSSIIGSHVVILVVIQAVLPRNESIRPSYVKPFRRNHFIGTISSEPYRRYHLMKKCIKHIKPFRKCRNFYDTCRNKVYMKGTEFSGCSQHSNLYAVPIQPCWSCRSSFR